MFCFKCGVVVVKYAMTVTFLLPRINISTFSSFTCLSEGSFGAIRRLGTAIIGRMLLSGFMINGCYDPISKVGIKSSASNQLRLEMARLAWSSPTAKCTGTMSCVQFLTSDALAANIGAFVLNELSTGCRGIREGDQGYKRRCHECYSIERMSYIVCGRNERYAVQS